MTGMRLQINLCLLAVCLLIGTASFAATSTSSARNRTALQRDLEGYAIGACLTAQDSPYLKDQGDGWSSAVIQRGKGGLDIFATVAAAVKTELAKGNMTVLRSESEPLKGKALPIMYCGEIVDTPSVSAAIAKAAKSLASSYR